MAADSLELMTDDWPILCPHCSEPLSVRRDGMRTRGLDCPSSHHFTAAKQGYVNLLVGKGSSFTPDSAEMIMARERVQESGLFDLLTMRMLGILHERAPRTHTILDAGAGTGHYLHSLLEEDPDVRGIALDLSPAGLKRAARHDRVFALAWDLWRPLPLQSGSIDVVLNVFAPRNVEEYARVLADHGTAVVVTPRPGHLAELAETGLLTQQDDKHESLLAQMHPHFGEPEARYAVTTTLPVEDEESADLVLMGPAGHHRSREDVLTAIQGQGIWSVTIDLDITVWTSPAASRRETSTSIG